MTWRPRLPHSPELSTDRRHGAARDRLPAAQRNAAVAAILALHAAAGWGLLQLQVVHDGLAATPPLFVDLLVAPTPTPSLSPAPTPTPTPTPTPKPPAPHPAPPPRPRPVIAAPAPVAAPAPFVAPWPEPAPVTAGQTAATAPALPAPAAPIAPAAPAPAPLAPAAPPPPRIPPSAVQYRVLPDVVYPDASRRLGEAGLVVVAVYIDAEGLPREVHVQASSGHERLDRAAVAGVRRARFRPWTEDGRPMAGWARIPIPFELEH